MMSDNLTPYRPKTAFGSPGGTAQTQGIDLGAGALGAGNALLFGLPEAALKSLGDEKQRQIIEAYKMAHPEYGVGETVGNVGSMFIPGGQIAKLASLGGKIAPLAKLGEVAAGAPSITQGLAAAAEQAVPRAFGSQQEGKDVGQRALEAGGQIGLGGALGGVLGGVKSLSGYIPKRPLEEIDEAANDQFLSQVFGKTLARGIRSVVGTKIGASGQIEKIDNLKSQMVDILSKNNIKNSQQAEDLVGENGSAWQKIGNTLNDAMNKGKVVPMWKLPQDFLDHPDIKEISNLYGKEGEDAIQKMLIQIKNTATDPANTFAKTREILTKNINLGFKGGTQETIQGEAAAAMKNYFDQVAMDLAPNADKDLKALKEIYPAFLAMGKALAREKAGVAPAFTPGSDTYARFVSTVTSPETAAQSFAGNVVGQAMNKLATGGANIIGSEAALGIKKMLPRQIPGDITSAPKEIDLPPGLANLLGIASKSTTAGTERAGLLPQIVGAGTQQATLTPDQNQQVPVIDRLPAPNFGQTQVQPVTQVQPAQPTPQDILEEKIAQNWDLLTDPNGLIEKGQPGVRQQFIDKVKSQLIDDQGNINYLRAAKALFPGDSVSAKNFLDSYQRFATIQKGLSDAVKLQTLGDAQATANKQAVIDATIDTLKKGGMDSKKAEEVVTGLLNNPLDDPGKKSAKLLNLLRTYDQIGFGKGGVLERAGVLR
jgi:hypothetical protein